MVDRVPDQSATLSHVDCVMAPTSSVFPSHTASSQLLQSNSIRDPYWSCRRITLTLDFHLYIPPNYLQCEWLTSPVAYPTHTGPTAGTHSCRRHREIIHQDMAGRVKLDTSYQYSELSVRSIAIHPLLLIVSLLEQFLFCPETFSSDPTALSD